MRPWLMVVGAVAGCAPPVLELQVLSPLPDARLQVGEAVLLDAELRVDGAIVEAEAGWSAPGWSATGDGLLVDDLPVGAYSLVARVDDLEVAVPIEVVAVPVAYDGVLDVDIDIDSPGTGPFTMECTHISLQLVVEPDGVLHGQGACNAAGDRVFDLSGQVSGADVNGEMVMQGRDEPLPFAGTRDGDIQCTFDHTWTQGEGSLRVYGGFTASPVEEES